MRPSAGASVIQRHLGASLRIQAFVPILCRLRGGADKTFRTRRRLHRYLSHKEVERLAQASGDNATFVYVAAYTGLRWGELTALRVADVDSRRRRLTVSENAVRVGSQIHVGSPKSHEMRSVPYPRFLEGAIAKLCDGKSRDTSCIPTRLRRRSTGARNGLCTSPRMSNP